MKDNSYAVGVNDKNIVCGWENSAFFICDGSDVSRHTEIPSGAHVSDFSDSSYVSGFFTEKRGIIPIEITSGFVWSPTHGIAIDSASMERQSLVLGINDIGEAVGAIYPIESTFSRLRDLLWNREVVWIGYTPPDPQLEFAEAVLWEDGETIPLKDLVTNDSPFDRLIFANDINDHGTIAGEGEVNGKREGFILEPLLVDDE